MKKAFVLFVLLIGFCMVSAQAAWADLQGEATTHVYALVNPNISLAGDAHVDAGSVQTGDFTAECVFRVDANTQQIRIWAEASPLYKGNDARNDEVAPIPLNLSIPVAVAVDKGSPLGTADSVLTYNGEEGEVRGFPTIATSTLDLESSQNNHFSQDLRLSFTWNQDDPEKPMGEYSGFVKMAAMVLPNGSNGATE